MTDQTDNDIASELIGYFEPLGAQWADLDDAVRATGNAHALTVLHAFGEQLKQWGDVSRLAAQRLEARGEISEAMVDAAYKAATERSPGDGREIIREAIRAALEASQKGDEP